MGTIKDRIKEFKRIPVNKLVDNPKNWRLHSDAQKSALQSMMEEVGNVGAVIVRPIKGGKYMLVDGHLRKDLADSEGMIAAIVTDLKEDEADKVLATYDPIGDLATADQEKLGELLRSIDADSDGMSELLESIADDNLSPEEDDEKELDEIDVKPSYSVVVTCSDEEEQQKVYDFVQEKGYSCRVLTL